MPKYTDKQVKEIAENLIGTSGWGVTGLNDRFFYDLTTAQFYIFDNIVFGCGVCGWWCDNEDRNNHNIYNYVCTSCLDDTKDNEWGS